MKLYVVVLLLISVGCANHQEAYYNAIQQQMQTYNQAYASVENESVTFEGTFTGTISIVKPKELPKMQHIEPPKSTSELALEWAKVIVPTAGMVAGMHYNYKSIDSNNKYNSKNIGAWTSNFDKTSVTEVSDTSVSDTTDTTETTNVTDISVKETTNITDTSVTDTSETITQP